MSEKSHVVNWFEIPVNDILKAKSFYETILGIELTVSEMGGSQMAWFPMHQGATGAAGTLVKAEGCIPSHSGTLVYLSVESIEDTLEKIETHGGKTFVPKQSIGEYGYFAHFEDCEGNRVALHSMS